MNQSITVETDLFEHREVKPHFIIPCCFGKDFATWLRPQLAALIDSGLDFFNTDPGRLRLRLLGLSRQGPFLGWFRMG
jgi:hypothetical protein